MNNCRTNLIILLLFWPLLLMSQSQDFWIKDFHQNMTDLSAISSYVKDMNGQPTALIRFAVRDTKFEFSANLGIVKQERKTGEVWLYVPVGTKRLTISHPYLGLLRGFKIPTSVEGKCTYDAEIVITNKAYLDALLEQTIPLLASSENNTEETDELESDLIIDQEQAITSSASSEINTEETEESDELESDSIQVQEQALTSSAFSEINLEETEDLDEQESDLILDQEQISSNIKGQPLAEDVEESKDSIKVDFYIGVGFNAFSNMGPSAHLGIGYKALSLEAGYVLGCDKVKDIGFAQKGASMPAEVYDYSCSKVWLRLGLSTGRKFKVSPQAGVSLNMINGRIARTNNSSSYYQKSTPISMLIALRLSFNITKGLYIHLTPQYDFAISKDDVYGVIKEIDSKIKAWGEGFGANFGLLYHF